MKYKAFLFFVLCSAVSVFLVSENCFADDSVDPSGRPDYGTGVGKKLGRGLANTAFGWTDFFKTIEEVGDKQNFVAGITWGPVYGLARAVQRTGAGVVEVVTFPLPAPNSEFEPMVSPEFPMQEDNS